MRFLFSALTLTLLLGSVIPLPLQAQDGVKVAVVNFREVVMSHPKVRLLEEELIGVTENANKLLEAKEKELLNIEDNMRMVSESGKLPDGTMKAESARILVDMREKALEVQESAVKVRAQVNRTIQARRAQELPKIAGEVTELVKTANHGRFTLVLDSSALSPEGFPQVIDFEGAPDLTSSVIALLPEKADE
ncbi:MAG: OmpH family outer membrane protein [Verrucomicrobiota bacterium]